MFARMTIIQVKMENIDDAIRLLRTSVFPDAAKQKGYRGACLLVNRGEGQGRVVTFWRSERDALASEENRFYQEQLVKFLPYFAANPVREGYEVTVHSLIGNAPKKTKKPPKAAGKKAGK
jgi:heme-degrading monooxygenase HmoA